MSEWRSHLNRAVALAGGQTALARKVGCSQTSIYKLVHTASGISAEMAIRIARATDNQVTQEQLKPALFGVAA